MEAVVVITYGSAEEIPSVAEAPDRIYPSHVFPMHHRTLVSIYLLLASLAGIIGVTVGIGNFVYQYVSLAAISDTEYLAGRTDDWRITQCQDPNSKPFVSPTGTGALFPPTPQEVSECESKARDVMVQSRHLIAKESAITGAIWGGVFLVLFLFHFPFFIRRRAGE
jgi:hypothetical protein